MLSESDAIHDTYPIYGETPGRRDTAFGVILLRNGEAHALAYGDAGWKTVTTEEVRADEMGIHLNEEDILRNLQEDIAEEIGAR